MKKILSLALALAMMLSLAACGGDSSGTKTDGSGDNSVSERTEVLTLRLGALGSGREDDIQSYPIRAFIDVVDKTGLAKFVTSFSAEFRGVHNNVRPLRTPSDFKGITFRVMSGQIFTDMFQALGASTATIAFSELYTALEQGAVQGEDIGASMHLDYSFDEVCPYSTEFNMTPTVNCLIFSNGAWNKLSESEIQIINEAADIAEKASYEYVHNAADNQYARLVEAGRNVIRYADLTDADLAACWDAVKPLWDKYESIVGTDLYNIMLQCCPYYD